MQGEIKRLARIVWLIVKLRRRESEWALPRDVKKGHFAVLACKGEEKKRFVVGLKYLKKPEFVRLLDKASEEYGFRHDGLIVIPCLPDELRKILKDGV